MTVLRTIFVGALLVVLPSCSSRAVESEQTSAPTAVSTTDATTTTLGDGSEAEVPQAEWVIAVALFDRGTAFALSIVPEGDLRAYSTQATEIANAWFDLVAEGSEVARDAYFCKARGFEQWTAFFRHLELGDPDEAEAAIALAEEYDIRGSDLMDEIRYGSSLRPEGSPTSCP